jgi:hypothetical protein
MRKIERINDFKFKQEAYEEDDNNIRGKVVFVNLGKPLTPLQIKRGQTNGFGRIKPLEQGGQEIFFWEGSLCEHLNFQKINGQIVNAVRVKTTDKGPRAHWVQCEHCAEPEVWEIVETGIELDGIPEYIATCTNKPNLGKEWIPLEVLEKVSEFNKPYSERRKKKSIWGDSDRITNSWFFSELGKPDQTLTRDGSLVLVYKDFGEKILTPSETYEYYSNLGLDDRTIRSSEIPKLEILDGSNDSYIRGEYISSNFVFAEFPELEFDKPVAHINSRYPAFLCKTTEFFNLLDESVQESVYKILREKKLSTEQIARKIFQSKVSDSSIDEIAIKLAILESGDTSQTRTYSTTRQAYEPESPDEMRGGFYYVENIRQTVITVAPKLIALGLLTGRNAENYKITFENRNKMQDTEQIKEQEIKRILSWKNSVLDSIDAIRVDESRFPEPKDIDSKIYELSGEEFLEQLKMEYQVLFDEFLKRLEAAKNKYLQKFREALEVNKQLLNQIQQLTEETNILMQRTYKLGVFIHYFYPITNENLQTLTNEQLTEYLNKLLDHKQKLEEFITEKEMQKQKQIKVEGKTEEEPTEQKDTFANKIYRIFERNLTPEEIKNIREISESDHSYADKRSKITEIIKNKTRNLEYTDQTLVENLINSKSNSKFLDRIFEILRESESNQAENTTINSVQEAQTQHIFTNPEIETESLEEDEAFSELPPALKPIAIKFIDIANSKGLEQMQIQLFDYLDLNDKNKQDNFIKELLSDSDALEEFVNLPPKYKNRVINAVIDEIEYLLNNETKNKS